MNQLPDLTHELVVFPRNFEYYVPRVIEQWSEKFKHNVDFQLKRKSNELEYDEFNKMMDERSKFQPASRLAPPVSAPTQPIRRSITEWPSEELTTPTKQQLALETALSKPPTDVDYESNMHTLISNIHKADGEWGRKRRELTMAIAKSAHNKATANTPAQATLQSNVARADEINATLAELERRHVTGEIIDHNQQNEAKRSMTELMQIAKESNKIKSCFEGVLHTSCFQ